jgi:hypothetical protein
MRRFLSKPLAAGLGAVAAVGATAFAATPASASTTVDVHDRCSVPLPGAVLGDPHVTAGMGPGVAVWHDSAGWHLRATHPGNDAVVFSGTVRSGQPISAHRYLLEAQDMIGFSRDRRTMTFRFVNHGKIDGIDFTDACAIHTSFSLKSAGSELPATSVYLGSGGAHPATDPFTVYRHR